MRGRNDGELKIRIAVDSDAKTITFIDNGIGMNEAVLSKIVLLPSAPKRFLDKLSESQKQDGQMVVSSVLAFLLRVYRGRHHYG